MFKIYSKLNLQERKMEEIGIGYVLLLFIVALIIFLYFENNSLTSTNITIELENLPKSFDGYTIVHLSDLHNKSFGEAQERVIRQIEKARPDLIVFTGDLIDSRHYGLKNSIELMKRGIGIAPIYYVTGNHEWRSGKFESLRELLLDIGVKVLEDTHDTIERDGHIIYIIGIDDPSKVHGGNWHMQEWEVTRKSIEKAMDGIFPDNHLKILLAHRPEKLTLYGEYNIDLVFAGHAHGGQIRLPFIGGVVAPNQGFFPKYTSGQHRYKDSTMVISRGLGNSIVPQRLFNRPEVVTVTLKNKR